MAGSPFCVSLIDMCKPGMNGLEAQARLRKLSPGTEVIFLTSRDGTSIRQKALVVGAFAFLLKSADGE